MTLNLRVGCDIGGTFTDIVLASDHQVTLVKIPSTPSQPEIAAIDGIMKSIGGARANAQEIEYICHATTLATNALIGEAELPKIGLITTKGFRDLLEIGRQIRPDPYDLFTDKPRPLIPRYLRKEVSERITSTGQVREELKEDEVRRVVNELKEENISSVAVCTLFSFLNPIHEQQIGEILHREFPTASISLSHQILPEFREYERLCTVIINSLLRKLIDEYLSRFERKLVEMGVRSQLLLMQSNGKAVTSQMARERPVSIIESGPAAGAIAAAYLGKSMGYSSLVSFDMGGTTAKVCLIEDGWPKESTNFEVGGKMVAGRIQRGSGWPIKVPIIDLVEIGSGGGSIAWIDSGRALRVGPKSAGAHPGPACYGFGGCEPTVTDAYTVLGVINPAYFLGGEMPINPRIAKESIQEKIAEPLGISVMKAAHGIVDVAISNMVRALKIVTLERGRDPRELTLIAFGGAGPMVADGLLHELPFQRIIIPKTPGLFSAYGLLMTDIGHDYVQTFIGRSSEINLKQLNNEYHKLEKQGIEDLIREGFPTNSTAIMRAADMRYVGQSYELKVPVPRKTITQPVLKTIEQQFLEEHTRRYGFFFEHENIEFVNLRVTALGLAPKIQLSKQKAKTDSSFQALKHSRPVYFRDEDDVECPIYDRERLSYGNTIHGPAIIEQRDSTTVLHPNHKATVDGYGRIIISRRH